MTFDIFNFAKKHKLIVFGVLMLASFAVRGGSSWAVSGASNYFPDTSPSGQAASYTVVQVTGANVKNSKGQYNADTKIKARTTVANVYVPKTMVNQTVTLTIQDGCDGTPRDNDSFAGSTDFRIQTYRAGGTISDIASINSRSPVNGCSSSQPNVYISFIAYPTSDQPYNGYTFSVYDSGVDYYIYHFIADASATETGSSNRYLNAFSLSSSGSVQVGISDFPHQCLNSVYTISCPSTNNPEFPGWSAVYSSFYGPYGIANYSQRLNIKTDCQTTGSLTLYDLDIGDTTLSQSGMQIYLQKNGQPVTVYSPNGTPQTTIPYAAIQNWTGGIPGYLNSHQNYGTGNNEYMAIPGGDPMFAPVATFDPGNTYTLTITGIDSDNAIQMLPRFSHCQSTSKPCTINSVTSLETNTSEINPGDRIKFSVTYSGVPSGYILGANSAPFNGDTTGIVGNYLIANGSYVRAWVPDGSASDYSISKVRYDDSSGFNQDIRAPADLGTYNFNWQFVKAGTGWAPIKCETNIVVTPKKVVVTCSVKIDNASPIRPGDRIRFTVSVRNASKYAVGVNGNGVPGGGSGVKDNYLTNGTSLAIRGSPTGVGGGSESAMVIGTNDAVDKQIDDGLFTAYTSSGPSGTALSDFYAPSSPGSYSFNWGLVEPGVGWSDVTCTSPQLIVEGEPPAQCTQQPGFFTEGAYKSAVASRPLPPNTGADMSPGAGSTDIVEYYLDDVSASPGDQRQLSNIVVTAAPSNYTLPATANGGNPIIGTSVIKANYKSLVDNYPYDIHSVKATYNYRYGRKVTPFIRNDLVSYTWLHYTNGVPDSQPLYSLGWPGAGWNIVANNYKAVYGPPVYTWMTGTGSVDLPTLGECEYRSFDLTPTATSPLLAPDPENPTSFTSTARVDFTLSLSKDPKNLLVAMNVNNIATTITYTVRHMDGSTTPLTPTSTVAATRNFGTSATGSSVPNYVSSATFADGPRAISIPPLQTGDRICMSYSTNPSVGTMDQSGTVKSISTGQRSSVTVQCSEYVVDRPYLRVYNSDTIAGSGFGVTCTTPDADIKGYIRQIASPPGYVGAGGQLGVFAKGSVTNFLSMSMSDAAMTDPLVNARTFAHESGTNTGGSFGQTYCATDFWNTRQSGLTSGGIAPADISAVSGQRQYDSGSTIHASSPISTQMAIYIDGDLTIDGDIKTTTGPWADVNAIPSVQVIVRGNIYILPSVKQLDGLYVAMPTNASNGRIVTCTNAAGVVHPSDTVISTVCRNNTLTVNGAFVAQQVNFFRGKGSLRSAQTSTITTTTSTPGGFGPQNTCTSPVIMYQDWRLSGATKTFTKGTYKNKTELTASFYDAISSMQVPVGCKVTVYKGDNLTGASKTMTSDWSVNDGYDGGSSIGWNDVIKSFKVEDANPGESQIGFIWSYSGIVDSTKDDCLSIVEAADNLWATPGDNYLCWPKGRNYGLQFSQSGAVAGKTCTQMYEADGSWTDNYLCWNTAANLQLTWLYANSYMNYPSGTLINGNYCTRIFEPAEATAGINHVPLDYWDNNYLCEPVRAGTPSMVPLPPIVTTTVTPSAGELANSPNIAEVFNYTPEMLLGTPASKPVVDRSAYDSLVSLPPAL